MLEEILVLSPEQVAGAYITESLLHVRVHPLYNRS